MGDRMREFLEFVARHLVQDPEQVEVTESVDGDIIVFRLSVAPDDVGRIIGREGRVIRAMRALLRAAAARQGVRVALQVQ